MKTIEEYQKVLELHKAGIRTKKISDITGTNIRTISDWLNGKGRREQRVHSLFPNTPIIEPIFTELQEYHYAHVLGLYLGDGCIATYPRTYKLRIFQDQKYPNLIQECKNSLAFLFPDNKIGFVQCKGCKEIYVHSQRLLNYFPQHGKGKKQDREIKLRDWQIKIIRKYPQQLIKGLINSDGSRYYLKDKLKNVTKNAVYNFRQNSIDIQNIFTDTLNLISVHWTRPNSTTIAIYSRKDVAILDTFIGAKS